jgi:hypothetical protein
MEVTQTEFQLDRSKPSEGGSNQYQSLLTTQEQCDMNFLVPRKKRLKGFCPVQIRKSKSSLENEEILQSKEPKIERKMKA